MEAGLMQLGRLHGSALGKEGDLCSCHLQIHHQRLWTTRQASTRVCVGYGGRRCFAGEPLLSFQDRCLQSRILRSCPRDCRVSCISNSGLVMAALAFAEPDVAVRDVPKASELPPLIVLTPRRRKVLGPRKVPCEHEECTVKRSNYGFPNEDATRCKRHMLTGMVIFDGGCEEPGCNTAAVFNFPGERKRVRCAAHKLEGMVDKIRPSCRSPGCVRVAWYGPEGSTKAMFCPDHKSESMVSIFYSVSARCQFAEGTCLSQATYGDPSENVKRFCQRHKAPGMVNLATSNCLFKGCVKQARYGWPTDRKHLFCPEHRREGMVLKWTCNVEGCFKTPCFGFQGEKSPSRCTNHKEEGMQHIARALCNVDGCVRVAYYALPGETQSRCSTHKDDAMVDVVHRRCYVPRCHGRARYCRPGEMPNRCRLHREEGMLCKG